MRVLTLIKFSEQLGEPPASFGAGMAADLPALDATFTMVDSRSLLPTAVAGTVLRTTGGKAGVVDGPFAEAKELVGGYAIAEVDSFEQAVEAARTFLELSARHWPGWTGEAEVRQIADF
jgi:hypothetical protein